MAMPAKTSPESTERRVAWVLEWSWMLRFLCGGGYADAPARLAGASELGQRVRLRTMRPEAKLSSAPVLAMPM